MSPIPDPPVAVRWGFWRAPAGGPSETIAEKQLAARLGWNLSVIRRQAAVNRGGGSGAYRLLGPAAIVRTTEPRFEVLRVSDWKRFGNAVRQLRHVCFVAERYGAQRIEFPEAHPFFQGATVGPFTLAWSPPLPLPAHLQQLVPPRPGLEGDFFYLEGLGLFPGQEDLAHVTATYLRPLLVPDLATPRPDVGDGDVVMHFRAGDVFGADAARKVHPGYGQPPLAFYLAAVARERPERVWIVFEDRSNPAVDAAEAALRARGFDVRVQSVDLKTDLHTLMSARCLVASFGTFCRAAASLSPVLRRYYCFEPPIGWLQRLGIHTVSVSDRAGDYRLAVMSNNWTAAPEQRALMLSYPEDALAFADHPPIS